MAPPLNIPHGLGGGAVRIMVDQWRRFAARLVISGLLVAVIVVGFAFHLVVAIRKLLIGWSSVPRPLPGPLPRLVAVPVRVIDTLERTVRRVAGSAGRTVHAVETPLRRAVDLSADRIVSFERLEGTDGGPHRSPPRP